MYHFSSSEDFCASYQQQLSAGLEGLTGGEIYVAPLYNLLIGSGKDIRYRVDRGVDVEFFGTPAEYEELLAAPEPR